MNRASGVLLWVSAAACWGQATLSGPVLGRFFDPQTRAIRPLWGIPGASTAGDSDTGAAFSTVVFSAAGKYALAQAADGRVSLIRFAVDPPSAQPLELTAELAADRILLSPSGKSAALQSGTTVQIVTGLPESPSLLRTIDLSAMPAAPGAMAVSDDGALLLASFTNSGLFAFAQDDSSARALSTAAPAALAFFPSSHDAILAGDPPGSVALLRGGVLRMLATDERLSSPGAVHSSPDGRRILIAAPDSGTVGILDVDSTGLAILSCNCAPTDLNPLNDSVFQITQPRRGLIWTLDISRTDPQIFFIPVPASRRLRSEASVNISTKSLPDGTVGAPYSETLAANGGKGPYTWAVLTGSPPPGLTLASSGTIAGTPTAAGNFNFTVRATDSNLDVDVQALSIRVAAAPALSIGTNSLPTGQIGTAYSQALQASGGVSPYSWSVSAGSLPAGLRISGNQISGTPTAPGTSNFTVRVTDSSGASTTKDLSIAITAQLSITNCPSGTAIVGQSYSAVLAASGGTAPYAWRIAGGSLPPGLSLDSARAMISGTPTQAGSVAFLLRVDDSSGANTTLTCSILVNPAQGATLSITSPAILPGGVVGSSYNQTLSASGGRPPYSWSFAGAGAPPGLALQPAGTLAGVPTAAGSYTFSVQVTDQDNRTAVGNFTLNVATAGSVPALSISGLPDVASPAQQIAFTALMDSAYTASITGTLTLTFTPDPTVAMDDPAVQFASGGRVMNFTVAPNSRTPSFAAPVLAIQTGTLAGSIQITAQFQSGGTNITPSTQAARVVRIDRAAPRIVGLQVARTSDGLQVSLVGIATTRDVTQAAFHFTGPSGAPLDVTVPLSAPSRTWFQSPDSQRFGGQFGMVQSFAWQGPPITLTSATVTLTNGLGNSNAAAAQF